MTQPVGRRVPEIRPLLSEETDATEKTQIIKHFWSKAGRWELVYSECFVHTDSGLFAFIFHTPNEVLALFCIEWVPAFAVYLHLTKVARCKPGNTRGEEIKLKTRSLSHYPWWDLGCRERRSSFKPGLQVPQEDPTECLGGLCCQSGTLSWVTGYKVTGKIIPSLWW